MVGDKIFLTMFNLYFFNQLIGMQMDFDTAFYSVNILDFTDVFPSIEKYTIALRGLYRSFFKVYYAIALEKLSSSHS
jgi:hypothetical protein